MLKIAITGGIGSGKSTVLEYIKSMGHPVFSCDQIHKEISKQNHYIQEIEKLFPQAVQEGEIQTKILSEIIFSNEEKRNQLNIISHKFIMEALFSKMQDCTGKFVFIEIPLLFEGGYEKYFDYIIVVKRNLQDRISAVQFRNGYSVDEVVKRIEAQFNYDSVDAKRRLDECKAIVIDNNNLNDLHKKIEQVILEIQKSVKH